MFYEEDEEYLPHKERMLKELYKRRTPEQLQELLDEALQKLYDPASE